MNDQTVLVVTAVAQDSTELPPASVYLRAGPGDTKLPRAAGVQSRGGSPDVKGTFGAFRVDVLYLLPVKQMLGEGDVLVDFAAHRRGLRRSHLSRQAPRAL